MRDRRSQRRADRLAVVARRRRERRPRLGRLCHKAQGYHRGSERCIWRSLLASRAGARRGHERRCEPPCSTETVFVGFLVRRLSFRSVEVLDLARWPVAEGFVQSLVVEPGDVLQDGELWLRAGRPAAVSDELTLEAVDEALRGARSGSLAAERAPSRRGTNARSGHPRRPRRSRSAPSPSCRPTATSRRSPPAAAATRTSRRAAATRSSR